MRDRDFTGELLFFSAVTGAFAAPVKALFRHFLTIPGLSSDFYDRLTLFLIMGNHPVKGTWNWVFGELGDIILGAGVGMILGLWLRASRPKYYWWIGLTFGMGLWFITLAMGNLLFFNQSVNLTPYAILTHLLTMLIYGVNFVLSALYWKALSRRIIAPEQLNRKK